MQIFVNEMTLDSEGASLLRSTLEATILEAEKIERINNGSGTVYAEIHEAPKICEEEDTSFTVDFKFEKSIAIRNTK